MTRSTRIALLSAALLVLVAGSALATQLPRSAPSGPAAASQEESPPTGDELAHAADRLQAAGIDVDADDVAALAADYGMGGAVRLLAWAEQNADGMSLEDIQALRDGGAGWGQIAKDLGLSPGIGNVMGNGGGHGRDDAPGQLKDKPADDDGDAAE
ncbi:MAG TPA: hypothetical protein VFK61_08270 [Candidatus Limnocylindria bacterium]|nr:hypothetical protein [Candidatus Limnocylindria bacterium]